MNTRVEVDLPEEVYRCAERLAQSSHRPIAEILVEPLTLSLPSLETLAAATDSVTNLADDALLQMTELQLPPDQDRQLSVLLDKQQAGQISSAEKTELQSLMQLYQEGLLRKSQALAEAVRRGLREPETV